jgi:GT2 family glycosyltransferase
MEARKLRNVEPIDGEPSPSARLRMTPRAVDVSIVIVTWNSERWISRCLDAVPPACEGLAYEVVVYDNGSRDRTLSLVPSNDVRLISSASNDGFAAATNRGIAATNGRYVFLLNPDCILAPRALTVLFDFVETRPDAAAAVPLLTDDDGGASQREFQLRRMPTFWTFVLGALAIDKLLPQNRWTAHYRYRDLDLAEPARVDQPAAAAMLLRRSVFDAIGPLDEQFAPAWFEDVDYCRRLAAAGFEIYVVPSAHGSHFGGSSLEHLGLATFFDLWYGNMWRYARKWFSAGQAEALRWAIIIGMLLRIPAALLGIAHREEGRRNALRAYITVLRKAFRRWDESPA